MTHDDTIDSQGKLRTYFDSKIQSPFVRDEEKDLLTRLLADALLSQGVQSNIKPMIKIENKVYMLANNVHTFGLKMCDMFVDERGFTRVDGVEVDARELWKALKEYCLNLFPGALSEAISISREKEKRTGAESYEFEATG